MSPNTPTNYGTSGAASDSFSAMLNRLFSRPLTLEISGQRVSFNSLAEFEFGLAGRTDVPSRQFLELMLRSVDDLLRETHGLRSMEQQLVETLSTAMRTPGMIGAALRSMDIELFSLDHGWRDIIGALRERDQEYEELQQVALAKYMQYLAARQEVIKHVCASKQDSTRRGYGVDQVSDLHTDDLTRIVGPGTPEPESAAAGDAAIREAVMLHSQGNNGPTTKKSAFVRLPKGEVVVIDIDRGQVIELMLSRHGFRIVATEELTLIDETGTSHVLQSGRNIIGRDTICNIVVSPTLRDISRLHLIIERLSPESLRLTDLSAHGTYLPAQLLNRPTN
jgi:hypothetical protein